MKGLLGLTAEVKTDYEIAGTKEDLQRLQLSASTMFWGIKCLDTSPPEEKTDPPEKPLEKPQRGETHPFGIAGKENPKNPN